MVKKYDKHGNAYHEPPYTEEEQMEMYRRMDGVVAFSRPEPKPKPKPLSERKVHKRGV